jgi:hypothetical protein
MRSFSSISEKLFNVVVDKCERPYSFVGRKKSNKPISTIQNAGTGFIKMVRGSQIPRSLPSVLYQEIDYTPVTFWHKSDIVQPDVEFQQEGGTKGSKKTSEKFVFTRRQHEIVALLTQDNSRGVLKIAETLNVDTTTVQERFVIMKAKSFTHCMEPGKCELWVVLIEIKQPFYAN